MKRNLLLALCLSNLFICSCSGSGKLPAEVTLTKDQLTDKIRGGWAGQVIGCAYGGPTEFKFPGIINDEVLIVWDSTRVKYYFEKFPGIYDDIYMDLTFVDVFQKEGLDAPIESFAKAFADAPYPLWHANLRGRRNIHDGLMPPESGHWKNNPHADDIDFQIEADYAGLMSPGMPNTSSHYSDQIGHMMNYGDGWYGGVYVAAMYALAFVSDDVDFVVTEALKTIPAQSKYHKAMADVIKWSKEYPDNWEITWALANRAYGYDIGCPELVDVAGNIDAVINSAYILIGLLYGEGDFFKTIDIATRCGQDSDCNPASAGGILGTMMGYDAIPTLWTDAMKEVSDIPFAYTDISFNKAVEYSLDQALQVVGLNGGKVEGGDVTIKVQKPETVRFEQSFEGHWPKEKVTVKKPITGLKSIDFNGNAIVVSFHYYKSPGYQPRGHVGEVEVYLDGELSKTVSLPMEGNGVVPELYFTYDLPEGGHSLSFKYLNKESDSNIVIDNYLVYSSKKRNTVHE